MDWTAFGLARDPFQRSAELDDACLPNTMAALLSELLSSLRSPQGVSVLVADSGSGKSVAAARSRDGSAASRTSRSSSHPDVLGLRHRARRARPVRSDRLRLHVEEDWVARVARARRALRADGTRDGDPHRRRAPSLASDPRRPRPALRRRRTAAPARLPVRASAASRPDARRRRRSAGSTPAADLPPRAARRARERALSRAAPRDLRRRTRGALQRRSDRRDRPDGRRAHPAPRGSGGRGPAPRDPARSVARVASRMWWRRPGMPSPRRRRMRWQCVSSRLRFETHRRSHRDRGLEWTTRTTRTPSSGATKTTSRRRRVAGRRVGRGRRPISADLGRVASPPRRDDELEDDGDETDEPVLAGARTPRCDPAPSRRSCRAQHHRRLGARVGGQPRAGAFRRRAPWTRRDAVRRAAVVRTVRRSCGSRPRSKRPMPTRRSWRGDSQPPRPVARVADTRSRRRQCGCAGQRSVPVRRRRSGSGRGPAEGAAGRQVGRSLDRRGSHAARATPPRQ